jgi:hypothetical protein
MLTVVLLMDILGLCGLRSRPSQNTGIWWLGLQTSSLPVPTVLNKIVGEGYRLTLQLHALYTDPPASIWHLIQAPTADLLGSVSRRTVVLCLLRPFSHWGDATAIRSRKKVAYWSNLQFLMALLPQRDHDAMTTRHELKCSRLFFYRIAVALLQWENGLTLYISRLERVVQIQ